MDRKKHLRHLQIYRPLIPVKSESIAIDIYVMVFQALFEAEERRKKDG